MLSVLGPLQPVLTSCCRRHPTPSWGQHYLRGAHTREPRVSSKQQETWLEPQASLVSLHLRSRVAGVPGKKRRKGLRIAEPPDGPIGEQAS